MADQRTTSQRVCWDPSDYIGFSDEQIKLIRVGFMHGLNKAFALEQAECHDPLASDESADELDTVESCDRHGTGEGRFHGVLA